MLAASSSSAMTISGNRNVLNFVSGDQVNQNNYYVYPPPNADTGNGNHHPVNNAPVDLLSVNFTGRREELEFLEKALSTNHTGVPSRCVVHGMPGLGKTHLVLRYAKLSFDQNKYSFVFWISATSVDKINQGISGILDLIRHRDRLQQDQTAKLTAARLWLEQSDHGDWLLVFDNVHRDTLGFLRSHLPLRNERGNILFTTRTKDVAETLANAAGEQHSILGLQPLELRESAELLFEDAGIDVNAVTASLLGQAEELVKCVGRLPLAIVQAASFMKQTHTAVEHMLELYKNERKIEAIRWENDLSPYEARSVADTFENQLNELNQQSRDIGNLLKLLSFLDPENIPVRMVVNGVKEVLQNRPKRSILRKFKTWKEKLVRKGHTKGQASDDVTEIFRISPEFDSLITLILSPIEFQTAIQRLQNLSLVELRSRDGTSSLWIHDLVQFMVREGARKEETYDTWLQSSWSIVYGMLLLIEDPAIPQWWPDCETLMPHLKSLKQWDDERCMNSVANTRIAEYLRSRGRYDEAETLCQEVLVRTQKQLGPNHPRTLVSMNRLALVYSDQGRYGEAESLYKKTLEGLEKQLGADHLDSLATMNNLAINYLKQGRYGAAEALFKKTIKRMEKRPGVDHQDVLASMCNLATVYKMQGLYDDAEALHKRTLESMEKRLGTNHPDTLAAMNHLASVYSSQERYDDAEALHTKTLEGREKHLGADHPDTLMSMNHLAFVYESQGRYGDAGGLYKKTLERGEKQLGPNHPTVLGSMSHLASVYESQGRYDDAEGLYKKSLEGMEKYLGTDHPSTLMLMNNFASVYDSQGRFDEAEALYEKTLEHGVKQLGPNHPDMLMWTNNLASVYESQGRYDDAEALYKKTLESREKYLGADHPKTLMSTSRLASVYESQGRYDDAEALHRRKADIHTRSNP